MLVVLETRDRTPLIVQGIPLGRHHLIAAYHAELARQYKQITMYWEPKCDRLLFEAFEAHYRAIAQRLPEPFDPAELTPESRHRFFVSDGMIPHPTAEGRTYPGLSQLESLLGMSYQKTEAVPKTIGVPAPPKAVISTGDGVLDLIVDTMLVFEDLGPWVIDRFDASAIAKLITQKCDRQRGDDALKEKQAELDKTWFVENEAKIMQWRGGGDAPGLGQ